MPAMIPWYEKVLASIVVGLILPLLLFGLRATAWPSPLTYWNLVAVCFAISFLVYAFRKRQEGQSRVRFHLLNFVISIVGLCVAAAAYLGILIGLQKLISTQ